MSLKIAFGLTIFYFDFPTLFDNIVNEFIAEWRKNYKYCALKLNTTGCELTPVSVIFLRIFDFYGF